MRKITFGEPVLKVEGLEVKFDVVPVSSSLAVLIEDKDLAAIVQQLHYWTLKGYGEVIDGVRWIHKSIDEWIKEVFPTLTPWKLGKMMKKLEKDEIIRREKLFTKHQIQNGDRFWWQPKNQTYYYSLNFEKLQELADNYQADGRGLGGFPHERPVQETAETPETFVFTKTQILSDQEIKDTKYLDCAKNNTDITSIENNSKDQSHPTLPCEWKGKKAKQGGLGGFPHEPLLQEEINQEKEEINQEKQEFSNPELLKFQEVNSFDSKVIEQDTNIGQVEEKINQNINTINTSTQPETEKLQTTDRPSPKLKAQSVTQGKQKREDKAPWQDETEKSQFYRELVRALPIVANSHSPQGLAKTIMAQVKHGEEHTYWDDFKAGLPIGSSTKPEWEIEPGVPYPMFIEYLTEKIIKGNNTQTQEQARNEVFRILLQPRQASAFWGQFKRSVINVAETVERDRALGVSNPHTPIWTRERIEPSIEEAQIAGDKIRLVNGAVQTAIEAAKTPQLEGKSFSLASSAPPASPASDPWTDEPEPEPQPTMREILAARGVKGFCKQMPKVSKSEAEVEERAQKPRKTHISQMSVAEINDHLTDPILRAQLMPQLWHSKYELITDEWGQIIAVESPPPAEE